MDTLSHFEDDLMKYLNLDPECKYTVDSLYFKLKEKLKRNKSGFFVLDDSLCKILQCGFPSCNTRRLKLLLENKKIDKLDEEIINNLNNPVIMLIV